MGVVWKAHDQTLERRVAIKQLLIPEGLDPEEQATVRQRFLREARAAAGIEHPAIISIYDVFENADGPWIVMRFIQGRSLDRIIRDDGPLPVSRVARVGLTLLDALE